jgi:hypothetical protein
MRVACETAMDEWCVIRPRHLNRNREDLGKGMKGRALVACQQVVQLEQSHE